MDISFIAINRIIEDKMSASPYYRKAVEKHNNVVLSDGRKMSDVQLLEKLKSFDVMMDKQKFEQLYKNFLSAEEMSQWIIKKQNLIFERGQDDWIWICLTVLWERWFPGRPSFEMIDDKMQHGYKFMMEDNTVGASEIWLRVWNDILNIMDSQKMKSINDFDKKFRGTQSVYNWVQELEMELGNAALGDEKFLYERISLFEAFISRFPREDSLMIENMKRALAESYFEISEKGKTEELYTKWLEEDPQWGWGWIGWADCYWLIARKDKNYDKAEEILKKGLAVSKVRDRRFILERLSTIYDETGRQREAEKIVSKMKSAEPVKQETEISTINNVLRVKTKLDFGEDGIPIDEFAGIHPHHSNIDYLDTGAKKKIGRNDPCPCGSGKKYKKCCGR